MGSVERDRVAHADAMIQQVLVGEAVARGGYVVLVADEEMHYLAASDAAVEFLGYTRDELLQMTVPDLIVESAAADLYDEFLQDGAQRGTITLRRKDGLHIHASYDARTTKISALTYFVSVLTPIEPLELG